MKGSAHHLELSPAQPFSENWDARRQLQLGRNTHNPSQHLLPPYFIFPKTLAKTNPSCADLNVLAVPAHSQPHPLQLPYPRVWRKREDPKICEKLRAEGTVILRIWGQMLLNQGSPTRSKMCAVPTKALILDKPFGWLGPLATGTVSRLFVPSHERDTELSKWPSFFAPASHTFQHRDFELRYSVRSTRGWDVGVWVLLLTLSYILVGTKQVISLQPTPSHLNCQEKPVSNPGGCSVINCLLRHNFSRQKCITVLPNQMWQW